LNFHSRWSLPSSSFCGPRLTRCESVHAAAASVLNEPDPLTLVSGPATFPTETHARQADPPARDRREPHHWNPQGTSPLTPAGIIEMDVHENRMHRDVGFKDWYGIQAIELIGNNTLCVLEEGGERLHLIKRHRRAHILTPSQAHTVRTLNCGTQRPRGARGHSRVPLQEVRRPNKRPPRAPDDQTGQ